MRRKSNYDMTPTFSWNLEKITIGISFQRAQNVLLLDTFHF